MWWGPDLIQFYNDAYAETMGPERHPRAIGQRGRECWEEIWPIIGPQIDFVMSGQGSTWDEDRLVPVTRHGRLEQVWWTYSYSPIDQDGGIGGVLVVCNDVTQQHLAREQLRHRSARLTQLFEQAPGFMAVLRGPDHVFELSNAAYRKLIGDRDIIGKAVQDVIPDVAGQGFLELLDHVYRTGEAYLGRRVPLVLQATADAAPREHFLDFVYQAIVEPDNTVSGVFVEGSDVTDHVRAEEHLRLINLELKHRVKNTLAMVSAIASQTFTGTDQDGSLASFRQRLEVFANAHDILTSTTSATAEIHEVINAALQAHVAHRHRIAFAGPQLTVGSKQAVSLALAMHELVTNAIKYGALSSDAGTVDIAWQLGDDPDRTFTFVWRERGGPPVAQPSRRGFGSRLIERVLRADFNGTMSTVYDPTGLVCRLTTPAINLQDTTPDKAGLAEGEG